MFSFFDFCSSFPRFSDFIEASREKKKEKNIPRCARGLYHLIENEGDDLAKFCLFQRRQLNLVGLYIFFLRCARNLFHLMEKWGDDLPSICDFQKRHLNLIGAFRIKMSALRARPLSSHNLNENDNSKKSN